LCRGREDAQRDGKVETSAGLGQVCRRQIHGYATIREVETGIEQRAAHAITTFPDSGLGHADDVESRQAAGQVRFYPHQGRVQSIATAAVDQGVLHALP